MPTENPTLQSESWWVPERTVTSPTELATILGQGCLNSRSLSYCNLLRFNLAPKKQVDQHLYVYRVGISLAERVKHWGFYLTSLKVHVKYV